VLASTRTYLDCDNSSCHALSRQPARSVDRFPAGVRRSAAQEGR
jgi:hypothetical protein